MFYNFIKLHRFTTKLLMNYYFLLNKIYYFIWQVVIWRNVTESIFSNFDWGNDFSLVL